MNWPVDGAGVSPGILTKASGQPWALVGTGLQSTEPVLSSIAGSGPKSCSAAVFWGDLEQIPVVAVILFTWKLGLMFPVPLPHESSTAAIKAVSTAFPFFLSVALSRPDRGLPISACRGWKD